MSGLLTKPEVCRLTSLSYPTLWRKMRRGEFPSAIQISAGRIAWRESEVQAWIDGLTASTILPKARGRKAGAK